MVIGHSRRSCVPLDLDLAVYVRHAAQSGFGTERRAENQVVYASSDGCINDVLTLTDLARDIGCSVIRGPRLRHAEDAVRTLERIF
jgi:hypothetical protein